MRNAILFFTPSDGKFTYIRTTRLRMYWIPCLCVPTHHVCVITCVSVYICTYLYTTLGSRSGDARARGQAHGECKRCSSQETTGNSRKDRDMLPACENVSLLWRVRSSEGTQRSRAECATRPICPFWGTFVSVQAAGLYVHVWVTAEGESLVEAEAGLGSRCFAKNEPGKLPRYPLANLFRLV